MTAPIETQPRGASPYASQPSRRDDGTALIELDPWLEPYADRLRERYAYFKSVRAKIDAHGGLLGPISQGHHYFGFNRGEHDGRAGVWYREWAPAAYQLSLIGDFNGWDRGANVMQRDSFGVWSTFLPDEQYAARLVHNSKIKVHVHSEIGHHDRIPAYIRRVVQEPDHSFTGVFWMPPQAYAFRHPRPRLNRGLAIYESHVGMATEQEKVGTFAEFTRDVLPRVKDLNYDAVQLMAVMEHPYYGSFGYHVSNFYAVSSRFGTPDDLKALIDAAHGMGLVVLLDLVHSHAVKNLNEGLNSFDGTQFQYFHAGARGLHVAWDSLLFDYSKYEVQRFLLSNVRYWLEEFRFDGFRFDGVTSMMYLDHGLGKAFTSYDEYFGANIDRDAVAYLQLANELAHAVTSQDCDDSVAAPPRGARPECSTITVAEDVSGMVGLARRVDEGGLGFDYRLAMGVPDYWIKLVKEKRDEDWSLSDLWHVLMNRRRGENHIGYAESHDQALVGDKTLAFWMMDKEMYWHMDKASKNVVVDRGIALHKMIRLITYSLAGEGWLTFMGNEFGHPEWVDFPREGNNFSYKYARRQWSLASDPLLRYQGLLNFDRAMNRLDVEHHTLTDPFIEQLMLYEHEKLIVYRRGPLVFVFNFNPGGSFADLRIPVPDPKDYKVILNTDDPHFEGHGRSATDIVYPKQDVPLHGRDQSVQLYLPSRSAQVLMPV